MARAVTSANALSELKTDLSQLSNTLHEVYDLMTADMSKIGQEWQDGQYEQFREAYSKQINRCEEVSVDYKNWCGILDTTISNVEAVEHTNVVSGGGTVGGGTAAAAAATATSAAGIGSQFNVNRRSSASPVVGKIDAHLKKNTPAPRAKRPTSKADQVCGEEFGDGFHGVPSSPSEADVHWVNTSGNDKVSSGIDVDLGVLKGKVGSEANSGTVTSEAWAKCVPSEE